MIKKSRTERPKPVPTPKKTIVTPHQITNEEIQNQPAPLTTADLSTTVFHYFSERIEFKTTFRPELWPRKKIVFLGLFMKIGSYD